MLATLGLAATLGAISKVTKKATSGGAVRCAVIRRGARKAGTNKGGLLDALLAGLAAPLILNTLVELAGWVKD